MICKCGKDIPVREQVAYGDRCEDCYSGLSLSTGITLGVNKLAWGEDRHRKHKHMGVGNEESSVGYPGE